MRYWSVIAIPWFEHPRRKGKPLGLSPILGTAGKAVLFEALGMTADDKVTR
jgi:hypothetical protein